MDWINSFNTPLSEENEIRFQNWLNQNIKKYNIDLSKDLETYDLRGFWINGGYSDEAFRQRKGHAPDTYKKPSHPTFSNESIYSNKDMPGGTWDYSTGKEVFVPAPWQRKK